MRRLIEHRLRKPDLDVSECTKIRLANGKEWYFPRPTLQIAPIFHNGEPIKAVKTLSCGDEIDALLEGITSTADVTTIVLAVMALGAYLLRRCYDLTDEDLERLFVYRVGDPDSEQMVRDIITVATGGLNNIFGERAASHPKQPAAGSPCPSSQAA